MMIGGKGDDVVIEKWYRSRGRAGGWKHAGVSNERATPLCTPEASVGEGDAGKRRAVSPRRRRSPREALCVPKRGAGGRKRGSCTRRLTERPVCSPQDDGFGARHVPTPPPRQRTPVCSHPLPRRLSSCHPATSHRLRGGDAKSNGHDTGAGVSTWPREKDGLHSSWTCPTKVQSGPRGPVPRRPATAPLSTPNNTREITVVTNTGTALDRSRRRRPNVLVSACVPVGGARKPPRVPERTKEGCPARVTR